MEYTNYTVSFEDENNNIIKKDFSAENARAAFLKILFGGINPDNITDTKINELIKKEKYKDARLIEGMIGDYYNGKNKLYIIEIIDHKNKFCRDYTCAS